MREPTADEKAGMDWWNNLSPSARTYWLERASCAGRIWDVSPADAWAAYKETNPPEVKP